jgi:hypothetical protein
MLPPLVRRHSTTFDTELPVLPGRESKSVELNNLAWLLSTCPRSELRDGPRAVALAIEACELSEWKQPAHLGTLGAAYAAVGRSHEAVTMQMRALQLRR